MIPSGPSSLLSVFTELRGTLLSTLLRLVGCRQTAEDLLHDAFVRVSQAEAAQGITHLRAFLFQTTRNLALDHLRREKLRRTAFPLTEDDTFLGVACPLPLPEKQAADRETVERLKQAMAGLGERRRTILLLHKVHGWRYADIARHLGISESAVEKNMRQALVQCMAVLEKDP